MAGADGKTRIEGGEAVAFPACTDQAIATAVPKATMRPRALVLLHWLTVAALVLAAAVILVRTQVDARPLRASLLDLHRHFGVCVLILFALRIAWRVRLGRLPDMAPSGRTMRVMAALAHAALYASLLVLPLLGWMLSDAQDKPVHFLGLVLPRLVQPDFDLADELLVWHQDAAWVLLGLTVLHLLAALWHHFVLRDAVLRGMWLRRR